MTVVESILLGLVQGASEFLPISSSGHLKLVQTLLGIDCPLLFDVCLHLGTALSVVAVFWQQIFHLFKHPLKNEKLHKIIFATICTLVVALPMRLFVLEGEWEKYLLLAGFVMTAILLWLSSLLTVAKPKPLWARPLWVTLLCGAMQGLATIPGLSRSCTTICSLTFCKVKRQDAVEFSFLLSLPIILASAVGEFVTTKTAQVISLPWYCFAVGIAVAFLSGLLGISLVQKLFGQKRQQWFALYMTIPILISILIL
ncbi:MAG: undecaprenyl-diphosphate phosphatase [Clostridia bacterium]|nr:undecaprenyl-diphosphate phosphatase [Clostridia bacterium]